ncbi:uncharacterized protein TNCV_4558931 [Trichonephila clavipes]|nr:uncharacterized protein TNCV_4558931 [Trichonephila clavipes]
MGNVSKPEILRKLNIEPGDYKENGTWQRRSNFELYQSYKESDIVNLIKIERIKGAGHVVRMVEDRTTKKVFNAQPNGT